MVNNKLKNIIKFIIKAQNASDCAKAIQNKLPKNNEYLDIYYYASYGKRKCYHAKDGNIKQAIRLINHYGGKEVRYFISNGLDQNNNNCKIIYFNIVIGGHFYQVSFHTFGLDYGHNGRGQVGAPTKWTQVSNGSRRAAEALAKIINYK